MTAALFSRGKGRRAATAACVVSLGLVALSACDKPTPLATVTVGSETVTTEAPKGCYKDGEVVAKSEKQVTACLTKKAEQSLKVSPGEKVRVGVDPKIAESGWIVISEARGVVSGQSKKTYRSLDSETLFQQTNPQTGQTTTLDSVTLVIVETGEGTGIKGAWPIKITRDA
ncbi:MULTISPECIES: hypothetical protein [Streptomyces]|uniref:Lipoprotein n=1 Tax=Streptomyces lonegramiae TaxID=3075524 RepID=A0ABU2XDR8_9ACTN|nr:hypothetical protein [Streptomyces sp. DSM 41529]MDT0544036.1 hypothetical protein [Streptomyces sp. DSM 41529]